MAYRTVVIPMTLSDLYGHATNTGLLKCDFLYGCAAADKVSSDSASCGPSPIAEPLVLSGQNIFTKILKLCV